MKIQRLKRARRILSFYKNNFKFRTPYQILIDGTFCHDALKCKLNIQEQMPKYLSGEVKLVTTPCVIMETEALGPAAYGAMCIVKQFQARKCGHEKKPIGASDCLLSMVSNDNALHYFIATQDSELTQKVRELPGVPLLYIKYNSIILEKPSAFAAETAEAETTKKLSSENYYFEVVKNIKKEIFGETSEVKKKKRKIKGPNPLSCKKSKKVKVLEPVQKKKARKRRCRVQVPKHIKESLEEIQK